MLLFEIMMMFGGITIVLSLGYLDPNDSSKTNYDPPFISPPEYACFMRGERGPGTLCIDRWEYNPDLEKCVTFNWSGYNGRIPFYTRAACQHFCEKK